MKTSLIFPLLLSFFPGWLLILKNYDELILADLLIGISIVVLTFGFCIFLNKLIQNYNKTSLIIGIGVALFFYFGYLQDALKGIVFFGLPLDKTSFLLLITIVFFAFFIIYVKKSKKKMDFPIKIANVIVITMFLVITLPIFIPDSFAEKPEMKISDFGNKKGLELIKKKVLSFITNEFEDEIKPDAFIEKDEEGKEKGILLQTSVSDRELVTKVERLIVEGKNFKKILDSYINLTELGIGPFEIKNGESKIEIKENTDILEGFRNLGKKGLTIQRYKGLGEMNPDQLWDTTMDPDTRIFRQVNLQDETLAEVETVFSTLMGDNVEPRKEFIEKHALDVENLDV